MHCDHRGRRQKPSRDHRHRIQRIQRAGGHGRMLNGVWKVQGVPSGEAPGFIFWQFLALPGRNYGAGGLDVVAALLRMRMRVNCVMRVAWRKTIAATRQPGSAWCCLTTIRCKT